MNLHLFLVFKSFCIPCEVVITQAATWLNKFWRLLVRISALRRVVIRDVKNSSYCCYVICSTLLVRVRGGWGSWGVVGSKQGQLITVHCKDFQTSAEKKFVVYWVILSLIPRLFGRNKLFYSIPIFATTFILQ